MTTDPKAVHELISNNPGCLIRQGVNRKMREMRQATPGPLRTTNTRVKTPKCSFASCASSRSPRLGNHRSLHRHRHGFEALRSWLEPTDARGGAKILRPGRGLAF